MRVHSLCVDTESLDLHQMMICLRCAREVVDAEDGGTTVAQYLARVESLEHQVGFMGSWYR